MKQIKKVRSDEEWKQQHAATLQGMTTITKKSGNAMTNIAGRIAKVVSQEKRQLDLFEDQ